MERQTALKALITAPYNSMDRIMETVGNMHAGDIIQVQVASKDRTKKIRWHLEAMYKATDFMIEDFACGSSRFAYIYVRKNSTNRNGKSYV